MSLVDRIARRDGRYCAWCGRETRRWSGGNLNGASADHIIPRIFGGANAVENMVLACRRCNEGRGSTHFSEWHAECRWRGYECQDDILYAAYWRALEFQVLLPRLKRERRELTFSRTVWDALDEGQRASISSLNAQIGALQTL